MLPHSSSKKVRLENLFRTWTRVFGPGPWDTWRSSSPHTSKYSSASQVSIPCRAHLPKKFLGSVASLVRKYEFLKNIAFIVRPGWTSNCFNSVQNLGWRLNTSSFEIKYSARPVEHHCVFIFTSLYNYQRLNQPHPVVNTHLSAQKLSTALYNGVWLMPTYVSGEKTQGFRASGEIPLWSGPFGARVIKNRRLNRYALSYRVRHKSARFLNPGLKQMFTRLATVYQDYTIYNQHCFYTT